MVQLSEGPVQRGNGKDGPTTPKPVILPKGQASAPPAEGEVAAITRLIPFVIDRAALAEQQGEGLSNRIASIAKAVQECAFTWEPDARLVGNVCAEDIADLCSAVLARWGHQPTPPAEGEVGELLAELEVAAVTVESEGGDHEAAAVRRAAELLQRPEAQQ